ncbi:FemAB family PEP-CTERM system-associated protein [Marinobacter salsuginis]|uniref:FemAB family XrtA/PEP-CTERM system-associated protein n=1 Tax=Marinobacter salsuginis TaxID=418719 RepID=UPI001C95EF73|nr:FemAB family XrtA/PEP-CTERM system-associated protein [Marinobacter salsuginis]MBY6070322.1 FemAB family PEP-CTERM system-associated protein [Marinobacter salsuginis]
MSVELQARVSRMSVYPIEEYDAYVSQHPKATPYHSSSWLKATERAYHHTGWLVTVHRQNDLCGVLPLVEVKPPVGSKSLVSLPFCDLGGPLADDDDVRYLLETEAKTLAETNKARLLEIREGGEALEQVKVDSAPRKVRMLCHLPDSSDTLFKSYKPKLRSQIRKAEKNGLRAEVRTDIEAVDLFYRVFAWNMRRLGSPVHSQAWFRELKLAFGDQMLIGLVFLEGEPVGAGIVLLAGNQACIPWASTLDQYNHLAPNMLLYWTLLSHVCDLGYPVFDFGRSTMGEGTYRFKKQWGARPFELIWTDWKTDDGSPQSVATTQQQITVSRLRPLVERLWRRLPLAFANWIGPKLRRYITL